MINPVLTGHIDWVYPESLWDDTGYSRKTPGPWENWAVQCDRRIRRQRRERTEPGAAGRDSSRSVNDTARIASARRQVDVHVDITGWGSNAHRSRQIALPSRKPLYSKPHQQIEKTGVIFHFD